jgi:UDP-3-O-[3-hydroxymyristoyl] glucosamine N-acyltransferase
MRREITGSLLRARFYVRGFKEDLMPITPRLIKTKFPELISEIHGNDLLPIERIASVKTADKTAISFVFKSEKIAEYMDSKCGALVVPAKGSEPYLDKNGKVLLTSSNPELAMALISKEFFAPKTLSTAGLEIHPSAVIAKTARLGKNVGVGANSVISEYVQIGEGTQISAGCVVEENVRIGKNCQLYPLVFVARDSELGDGCVIQSHVSIGSQGFGYAHDKTGAHYHKPHLGKVILGKNVEVGAGTQIDRGTVDDTIIGDGTKIDNLCHFGHNAVIGKNCLITAMFVSAGSVKIGDNFVCGGRTTIAGHLEVGNNITIAAHSTVGGTTMEAGAYGGYPLVDLTTHKKNQVATQFLAEMKKNVSRLMKKVFEE